MVSTARIAVSMLDNDFVERGEWFRLGIQRALTLCTCTRRLLFVSQKLVGSVFKAIWQLRRSGVFGLHSCALFLLSYAIVPLLRLLGSPRQFLST
jgi:hypothetical protein